MSEASKTPSPERDVERRRGVVLTSALAVVLGLALWLRLAGIGFGLPYLYHTDEPSKVTSALNMIKTGDLNPHYFKKPTLLIYANALVMSSYVVWAKATGRIGSADDIAGPERLALGVGKIDVPELMLFGRALSGMIGVAGVLLVFLVGKRYLKHPAPALFATLAYAVSYEHVVQSHYIETNVYLAALLLATSWAALRLYESGERRAYLLTGFLVGVAVTCKYPGIVGIVMLAASHFLRSGWRPVISLNLVYACLAIPVGFLVGTPFALLDLNAFLRDTLYEVNHYSTGHDGFEGEAPSWYLTYAWKYEGPLLVVSLIAAFRALVTKNDRLILLASFPLVYFPFISSFEVRNGRTFMPLVPFAFLLGAGLLFELAQRVRSSNWSRSRRMGALVAIALVALFSIEVPLAQAIEFNRVLAGPSSRETSRVWIERNIPEGSRVAMEAYGPWLPRERYRLKAFHRLVDQPQNYFKKADFDYIVSSERMYGRYMADRERYGKRVKQYEALFKRYPVMKTFREGEWDIRVHRVR